jgi:cobalt/nickel transport system permease protein
MHMADALISPPVGGAMWAASVALAAYSARQIKPEIAERKIPLMGVIGAFVFAAQMINVTIPGTGSSGHLGGGMILTILLGPHAAFLVMFSILAVQALFFADGGLLALGCNVFNLGFWPCFVIYPLVFKKIVGKSPTHGRLMTGSIVSGVLSLQLGAFCVVLQTLMSGISELPFGTFLLLMQPIHLAIGIVEGIVTAALVSFVWRARPELLELSADRKLEPTMSLKPVLTVLAIAALVTGALLSWFASTHPDGLEWAMFRITGKEELAVPEGGIHAKLARVQEKTAFMPDYGFAETPAAEEADIEQPEEEAEAWPAVSAGTSVAGIVGGGIVLLLAVLIGMSLRLIQRRSSTVTHHDTD